MKIVQVVIAGPGLAYVGHPESSSAHAAGTIILADDGQIYRLDTVLKDGIPTGNVAWLCVTLPTLQINRITESKA